MPSYRKRPRRKIPPPLAGGGEQSDAQQTIARGRGISTATRRSRELRAEASQAERKLWEHLRRKPVHDYRFRRQFPLGPYFADFCCLSVRLVIEVDGDQHAQPEQVLHDARRTAWLNSNRFRVIRFSASDVMTSVENILDEIGRVVLEQEQLLRYAEPQPKRRAAKSSLPLREGANSSAFGAKNLGEGYALERPLPCVASLRAPSREGRGE